MDVVRDGEEAMLYLKGSGACVRRAARAEACLLVTDLDMPGVDGFELLEWLRREPGLQRLPVVVLSSSSDLKDVRRAVDLGASGYFEKPTTLAGYDRIARVLEKYWLQEGENGAGI